jgi:transposase
MAVAFWSANVAVLHCHVTWFFIGEADSGQRSAIIYSIIDRCRRRGVDPHAYLRDVLTRLPHMTNRQVKDITPEAWAALRSIPL